MYYNKLLNPNLIMREAQRLAVHFHLTKKYDLNCKIEYDIGTDKEVLICSHNNRKVNMLFSKDDTKMSIDDFSEVFIKPLVHSLCDWDRAFRMETWI